MASHDVVKLREELEAKKRELLLKQTEYDSLQNLYDNYTESSAAIEQEYESELNKAEERIAALQKDVARGKESLDDVQARLGSANAEVSRLTRDVGDLRGRVSLLEAGKRALETELDELQGKCRALEASEERLRYQGEAAAEQKILLQHELEDLRQAHLEAEARLREELQEQQSDVLALRMAQAATPAAPQAVGEDLAEELRFLRAQCEEQLDAIVAAEQQAGKAKTNEANLKASLAAAEGRVLELQALLDDAEAALLGQEAGGSEDAEALRGQLRALEAQVASLRKERDQALAKAKGLEAELDGFEQQLEEDTTLMAEQELKVQELRSALKGAEGAAAAAKAEAEEAQRALAAGHAAAVPESRLEEAEREELCARVDELEVQLQEARRRSLVALRQPRHMTSNADMDAGGVDTAGRGVEEALRSGDATLLAGRLKAVASKLQQERSLNSKLLLRMQNITNKIQVYCRVRPINESEVASTGQVAVEALTHEEVGYLDPRGGGAGAWRSFAFDRVWGAEQTQEEVFLDVAPLVLSVVDGHNACIMAYGQTGSGKTFTMQGTEEDRGMSFRVIRKVLELVELRRQAAQEEGLEDADGFRVSVSMVEVYNDEVRDLLRGRDKEGMSLDIRRDANGMLLIPGMVEEVISTVEEGMAVIERGNNDRAVAATNVHEHSSRSHSILMLNVTNNTGGAAKGTSARLYLVDLAGSERVKKSGVTGAELKEAQSINRSLSALGDVMEALDKKSSHIPYRNSKLTHLLQDCLGGVARTLMIFTVTPLEETGDESLCTLQFSSRVRSITLPPEASCAKAKNSEAETKALRAEARALAAKKAQAEEALAQVRKELTTAQRKASLTSESKSRGADDARRAAEERAGILTQMNQDLNARLAADKAAREKAAAELEEAQRQMRKLQSALDAKAAALVDARTTLAARDQELVGLRKLKRQGAPALRASPTAAGLKQRLEDHQRSHSSGELGDAADSALHAEDLPRAPSTTKATRIPEPTTTTTRRTPSASVGSARTRFGFGADTTKAGTTMRMVPPSEPPPSTRKPLSTRPSSPPSAKAGRSTQRSADAAADDAAPLRVGSPVMSEGGFSTTSKGGKPLQRRALPKPRPRAATDSKPQWRS